MINRSEHKYGWRSLAAAAFGGMLFGGAVFGSDEPESEQPSELLLSPQQSQPLANMEMVDPEPTPTPTVTVTVTATATPQPIYSPPPPRSVYYRNCSAARAAGAAPVRRGQPGYGGHLDRDNDGIGCE